MPTKNLKHSEEVRRDREDEEEIDEGRSQQKPPQGYVRNPDYPYEGCVPRFIKIAEK